MSQTEQQLAETYLEMHNTHQPDLVDRYVAVEYRNHNPFVADGREANRHLWTMFYAALPDIKVTQEDLIISGDRVIGRYTYRGTQTGEFMGIPASGNPIAMRSIDIWRVKDGMFVEHWDELNVLEVFQQMGVIPPLQVGSIEAA
jgi:predicted SnoaL-like aldol condensation-catalyzing enzyme